MAGDDEGRRSSIRRAARRAAEDRDVAEQVDPGDEEQSRGRPDAVCRQVDGDGRIEEDPGHEQPGRPAHDDGAGERPAPFERILPASRARCNPIVRDTSSGHRR